jgi:hypothetical protein
VACIYLKDLSEVDLEVLAAMIQEAYATLTKGVYTERVARTPRARRW